MEETMTAATAQSETRSSPIKSGPKRFTVRGCATLRPALRLGPGTHAKRDDSWAISGYLGKNAQFDEAMGKFALAYAD
jgi:hypothetical protein